VAQQRIKLLKAVIFDFDGTLTALTLDFSYLKEEITKIAVNYMPVDMVHALEGHYIIETIYGIAKQLDREGLKFQKEAFKRLNALEIEAAIGKDVYPYTRTVLAQLHQKNIKTGIITRTCRGVLKQVFPDMDNFIDIAVTREDIREVKPDPAHVKEALRMLDVLPEEAMVVGDHPTDIRAGRALNMKTAGVLTGRTGQEAFHEEQATFIFDDIRGIIDIV
jgi:phosphoglycolate phosphatase